MIEDIVSNAQDQSWSMAAALHGLRGVPYIQWCNDKMWGVLNMGEPDL
jgi:hypothetical protein